jgi:TonB family protein
MIVAAAIVLGVGLGIRILSHQAFGPAAQTPPVSLQPSSETAGEQSPAPFSKQAPVQQVTTPGSVLHQVMPEVSRSALNTITGRIKVSVHVAVDASGNVSQAELVSAGPSRYFADRSLAAARRWKFAPPKIGGQPTASEWLLRFHIGRVATQVFPSPTKP